MLIFNKLGHKLKAITARDTEPGKAYNLWSDNYDKQPDNLMLYLDELIFRELLKSVSIRNKKVLDFGCGTGRHWNKLYNQDPEELIGVDISKGMLDVLKEKYPAASIHLTRDNLLDTIADHSIDTIISTLTVAHIRDLNEAFATWQRIIKVGGNLLISDFHPELLDNGGKRVFTISGKVIRIKNYVHSLESIQKMADSYDFMIINKLEKHIDENLKPFYEKQHALHVYEKYIGYPVIYGLHLKKK
jgi:ubiquinone/menaquinone biosynthesis C-methylase UbiE